jgi:GDP-L-fucose synthase
MLNKSTLLITGSSGLLGSAFVRLLQSKLDKENTSFTMLTPRREELDCSSLDSAMRYFEKNKPDYVFHFASLVFGLGGNLKNQLSSLTENVAIAQSIFSAAAHFNPKKIFYAGTASAYPHPFQTLPLEEKNFGLRHPHKGELGYAYAKLFALDFLDFLKSIYGIDYCYGILTNMYGLEDRFNEVNGNVVPSLIARAFRNIDESSLKFQIWGNADTTRDFMFADDAAEAVLTAFEKSSGALNIGTGIETSIKSLVETINACLPSKLEIEWDKNKPIGINRRVLNVENLTQLGFHPKHSLSAGIKKTVEAYKKNRLSCRK